MPVYPGALPDTLFPSDTLFHLFLSIWQDPGEIVIVLPERSQKGYLVDQLLYLLDLLLRLLLVGIASYGNDLPELASGDRKV